MNSKRTGLGKTYTNSPMSIAYIIKEPWGCVKHGQSTCRLKGETMADRHE
jgi:hypothetical protein